VLSKDAERARHAPSVQNFIFDYCSNYTGRRRRKHTGLLLACFAVTSSFRELSAQT
jgi:hypothetical protein